MRRLYGAEEEKLLMPSALITILLLYALLALAVASVLAPFISVGFALWKHQRHQAQKQRLRREIPAKSAA